MSIRELSSELAKKAKDELFEDPERILPDIKIIKDWLAEQHHINARTDDQWIVAFLRGCKYNLTRTKDKLDLFYTMRTIAPEMCLPMDPMSETMQHVLKSGILLPLKKTENPADPRVVIYRPGLMDLSTKIKLTEYVLACTMILYIHMLEDDQSVVAGVMSIIDMANFGVNCITHLTPPLIKKITMTGQDVLPLRQKGLYHINCISFLKRFFDIFKFFLNAKLKKRLSIHNNMGDLYKLVPKSILPPEYGGDGDSVQEIIDEWKNKVESYQEWFLDDLNFKTDESKRPGGPKTARKLFGIMGWFS